MFPSLTAYHRAFPLLHFALVTPLTSPLFHHSSSPTIHIPFLFTTINSSTFISYPFTIIISLSSHPQLSFNYVYPIHSLPPPSPALFTLLPTVPSFSPIPHLSPITQTSYTSTLTSASPPKTFTHHPPLHPHINHPLHLFLISLAPTSSPLFYLTYMTTTLTYPLLHFTLSAPHPSLHLVLNPMQLTTLPPTNTLLSLHPIMPTYPTHTSLLPHLSSSISSYLLVFLSTPLCICQYSLSPSHFCFPPITLLPTSLSSPYNSRLTLSILCTSRCLPHHPC